MEFVAIAVGGASKVEMLAEGYYAHTPDLGELIRLWDETEVDFDVEYIQVYQDGKYFCKFIK